MKVLPVAALAALSLGACTSAQLTAAQTKIASIEVAAVKDANTFCKVADQVLPYIATGASIASVVYPPAGAVMVVISDTADPLLAAACKAAGGLTVSPVKPAA